LISGKTRKTGSLALFPCFLDIFSMALSWALVELFFAGCRRQWLPTRRWRWAAAIVGDDRFGGQTVAAGDGRGRGSARLMLQISIGIEAGPVPGHRLDPALGGADA